MKAYNDPDAADQHSERKYTPVARPRLLHFGIAQPRARRARAHAIQEGEEYTEEGDEGDELKDEPDEEDLMTYKNRCQLTAERKGTKTDYVPANRFDLCAHP